MSADLFTALQAFRAAPTLTTMVASVDSELDCSAFTHQDLTAIIRIIDANRLGAHLSMHGVVSLLTF